MVLAIVAMYKPHCSSNAVWFKFSLELAAVVKIELFEPPNLYILVLSQQSVSIIIATQLQVLFGTCPKFYFIFDSRAL